MRAVFAIALLLADFSVLAHADDAVELGCKETSAASYEEIMAETKGMNCQASEYNIGRCMWRDWYLSEIALAEAKHGVLETSSDQEERAAFTKAENAWCAYREAVCDWEPSADGGSMSGQLYSQCRKERNEAHTKALKKWIDCMTLGCENPPLFFKLETP
jgi:uncharacterized protein YecT (DUF1311 family)